MKAHIQLTWTLILLLCTLSAFAQAGTPTLQVIKTFDLAPTALGFSPEGISRNGLVAGTAEKANTRDVGFLLDPHGREVSLVFPNSNNTYASGVNSSGTVCGTYLDFTGKYHGWFCNAGVYNGFDVPGSVLTEINGINDTGDFCGTYYSADGFAGPFLDLAGSVIPINLGDATSNGQATGISSNGLVTGIYLDLSGQNPRVFIRETDGSLLTDIKVPLPHIDNLSPTGINRLGYVVGSYPTGREGSVAFVFRAPATFIFYSYPEAVGTSFRGINDRNQVVGSYQTLESDGMIHEHGVLLQLQN